MEPSKGEVFPDSNPAMNPFMFVFCIIQTNSCIHCAEEFLP